MPSLSTVRTAIATALSGISGLHVDPAGLAFDRTNLPAALIEPADDAEPATFGGTVRLEHVDVIVAVSLRPGTARAQEALDALHDAALAALEAGLPALLSARRQSYGVLEVDGLEVMGAVLRLELLSQ